mmetsp:Transcript_36663/g.85949  ORF Transcript_36663/g.85949 Transcript_36663/m.85949 type:complete len:250 (+) Transcript_36663:389-1138(+)
MGSCHRLPRTAAWSLTQVFLSEGFQCRTRRHCGARLHPRLEVHHLEEEQRVGDGVTSRKPRLRRHRQECLLHLRRGESLANSGCLFLLEVCHQQRQSHICSEDQPLHFDLRCHHRHQWPYLTAGNPRCHCHHGQSPCPLVKCRPHRLQSRKCSPQSPEAGQFPHLHLSQQPILVARRFLVHRMVVHGVFEFIFHPRDCPKAVDPHRLRLHCAPKDCRQHQWILGRPALALHLHHRVLPYLCRCRLSPCL